MDKELVLRTAQHTIKSRTQLVSLFESWGYYTKRSDSVMCVFKKVNNDGDCKVYNEIVVVETDLYGQVEDYDKKIMFILRTECWKKGVSTPTVEHEVYYFAESVLHVSEAYLGLI